MSRPVPISSLTLPWVWLQAQCLANTPVLPVSSRCRRPTACHAAKTHGCQSALASPEPHSEHTYKQKWAGRQDQRTGDTVS